jgi:hypothetical protein
MVQGTLGIGIRGTQPTQQLLNARGLQFQAGVFLRAPFFRPGFGGFDGRLSRGLLYCFGGADLSPGSSLRDMLYGHGEHCIGQHVARGIAKPARIQPACALIQGETWVEDKMAAFCGCCGAEITLKAEMCPVCGTPRHGMAPADAVDNLAAVPEPAAAQDAQLRNRCLAC